jgi:hypothetical protein
MVITVQNNGNYGPPEISTKYAPLENVQVQAVDTNILRWMLRNRTTLARLVGLGQTLELITPGWQNLRNAERAANQLAPIVVVSSGRASWIAAGVAAAAKSNLVDLPVLQSPSDMRALRLAVGVPIYAPPRLSFNGVPEQRSVYVVVHANEYRYYQRTLAGTGITPVGWRFRKVTGGSGGPRDGELVGFGATRFAAMEFCKRLYRAGPPPAGNPPWHAAWIVDDNVVALTNFRGFAAVENNLANNLAASFQGDSKPRARDFLAGKGNEQIANGRGQAPANLAPVAPIGVGSILQQIVLWNIQLFENNNLNFSPLFVTSGEDLSISRYFDGNNPRGGRFAYQYYAGISVWKEEPTRDEDSVGLRNVEAARDRLTKWFTDAERATPPTAAPPPVQVQTPAVNLPTFIETMVKPNAFKWGAERNAPRWAPMANSHAAEQIICRALETNIVPGLPAANIPDPFRFPTPYPVQTIDRP